MTADEVKEALRRRHSATQPMGQDTVPGAWTVIEELHGIDVVAFSAHATAKPNIGVKYARIGYEVKVSRSDLRRELLRPAMRSLGVSWCNAFYFAVPAGLLSDIELAYEEPDWAPGDFRRYPCPHASLSWNDDRRCYKGKVDQPFIGPLPEAHKYHWNAQAPCELCQGKGYLRKARVEEEAPTLWVPRDVGLITVDGRGCHVTKRSPVRQNVPGVEAGIRLNDLVRWISARPDPRHYGLVREPVQPQEEEPLEQLPLIAS